MALRKSLVKESVNFAPDHWRHSTRSFLALVALPLQARPDLWGARGHSCTRTRFPATVICCKGLSGNDGFPSIPVPNPIKDVGTTADRTVHPQHGTHAVLLDLVDSTCTRFCEFEGALRRETRRRVELALITRLLACHPRHRPRKQHQHGVARKFEDVSIVPCYDSYRSCINLVDMPFQSIDAQ